MNRYLCVFLLFFAGFWAHSQMPGSDLSLQQGGHVRFDFGQNGCAGSSIPASIRVDIHDGDLRYVNYANASSGSYSFLPGSYTVSPQLEYSNYFTVLPSEAHVEIGPDGSFADFCIASNGFHADADVTIIPDDYAVAGQINSYRMIVRNIGNQTINGVAKMMIPANAVEYVSSTPATSARNASSLQWNYENLRPFESRVFHVQLQITPSLDLGEQLSFTANVTNSLPDDTPSNNIFDLRLSILASTLGPNNKICLEGDVAPPAMIGQYLNYVINFENNTSSVVQKVVINDEIDTNQFEMSSLQFTNMSHPGIPLVIGNKVEIYFQDINLQPGAQGNAAFKIKTKSTIPVGSTVSNKAKIYFDFNFPIETNTALTTFQVLGLPEIQTPDATIFPNPGNGNITVESNQTINIITVLDAQGRTIGTITPESHSVTLDVSHYTSGLYHLQISTENGTVTRKLIKQ